MISHPDPGMICWRIHLLAAPQRVYQMMMTAEGQAQLRASLQHSGMAEASLPVLTITLDSVQESAQQFCFAVEYEPHSRAQVELIADPEGGTNVTISKVEVPAGHRALAIAAWVAMLWALKAVDSDSADLG